jgi:WD40 repeat protein
MIMAAISPCGRYVAASGKKGRVWLWDQTQEHQEARKLEAELDKVTSLSFNYEATQLAVALRDRTVCVFCTKTRNELHRCCGHTGVVHSISFGPNGLLASGSRDGTAKLWRDAECIHTFLGHSGSVNAVSISPDGEFLATGSEDSTAKLWNLTRETYECSLTLEGHIAGLSVLAFASGV